MEIVRVPLRGDCRADPVAMENAISERTVALVGSAVCWSYGLFDPISAMAEIARRHDLWLHVDASVGGWIARFICDAGYHVPDVDFSVPGVCSISADLHKYGRTAKPASTIFFREPQLYEHTVFRFDNWPGGGYETGGTTGSRPGGAIASAWAVIQFLGSDGFLDLARQTMTMKERLVQGLRSIDGIIAWDTDLVLQVYGSSSLDIGAIATGLRDRGHAVMGTATPPRIHLQCDTIEDDLVDAYVQDVAAAAQVRAGRATGTMSVGYL